MEKTTSPVTAKDREIRPYKPVYGIIIICVDEPDQKQVYIQVREKYPDRKIKVVSA